MPTADCFKAKLGREVWLDLHTIALFHKDDMDGRRYLINTINEHYPCRECREHIRQIVARNRADIFNTEKNNQYAFFYLHNLVNKALGKRQQPISILNQYKTNNLKERYAKITSRETYKKRLHELSLQCRLHMGSLYKKMP